MFSWRSDRCCQCGHHHPWRSFWRGMAAMLVLALAVLGLFGYRHGHHVHRVHANHTRAVASAHRPRPKTATARPTARQVRPAGHPHSPDGGTSLAAAGQCLRWSDFHGIELSASPAAGPHHALGGLVSGFTDTPPGALLAAVNIAVRTAADWGPSIFRPTIANQVTGRSSLALLRAALHDYAQASRSGRTPAQPAASQDACRFLAFTPATATIDLVTSGPATNSTPVLVMTTLRVLWLRGDWRLVAPPAGNWARASAQISSLAGYTILPNPG